MNKFWNVIASLSVLLVLAYVSLCGYALVNGDATLAEFKEAVLPIMTAVLGYMAAMLPKPTEAS